MVASRTMASSAASRLPKGTPQQRTDRDRGHRRRPVGADGRGPRRGGRVDLASHGPVLADGAAAAGRRARGHDSRHRARARRRGAGLSRCMVVSAAPAAAAAPHDEELGCRRLVDQQRGDVPQDGLLQDVDLGIPVTPRDQGLGQRHLLLLLDLLPLRGARDVDDDGRGAPGTHHGQAPAVALRPREGELQGAVGGRGSVGPDDDPSTRRARAGPGVAEHDDRAGGVHRHLQGCRTQQQAGEATPARRTQYDDGGGRCPAEQHHRRLAGLEHGVDVDVACQRAGLSNGGAEDVVGGTPLLGDERRVRTLEGPAVPLAQRVHDAQPRRTSVRLLHGPPHGSGVGGRSVDPDDDRARCLSSVHHGSPFRSRVRGAWGRRQRPIPPGSGRRRLRSPLPQRPAG